MLGNGSTSTKSIEALVEYVTIFDISTNIGSGTTLVCACWKTFPTLRIRGFAHLTTSSIVDSVICKALNVIWSVSGLTLISHWVGITGVDVSAVINVDLQVLMISVITIVPHEGHYKLAWSGASQAAAVPTSELIIHLVGPVVALHLFIISGGAAYAGVLQDLIKPILTSGNANSTFLTRPSPCGLSVAKPSAHCDRTWCCRSSFNTNKLKLY